MVFALSAMMVRHLMLELSIIIFMLTSISIKHNKRSSFDILLIFFLTYPQNIVLALKSND